MNPTFGNSPDAPARVRAGRPRSEQSRAAVLRATSELLHGVGLQAMTTDEIAGRSGVSEATIYKWWPNKYAVAVEAFLSAMMAESSDPDTRAAREDLRSMLRGANPIRLCARNCGIISWPLGAKCYGRSGTAA